MIFLLALHGQEPAVEMLPPRPSSHHLHARSLSMPSPYRGPATSGSNQISAVQDGIQALRKIHVLCSVSFEAILHVGVTKKVLLLSVLLKFHPQTAEAYTTFFFLSTKLLPPHSYPQIQSKIFSIRQTDLSNT